VRSAYDPYNRDEERELERAAAARAQHEAWSLEQSKHGASAMQRENVGIWIQLAPTPPKLPPEIST
jgi:hypothetical protein